VEDGTLRHNARDGDELEIAQALVILALHEAVMRRPSHGYSKYYTMATEILVNLGVPDWDVGEEPPPSYALSRKTSMNSLDYRTTWRRRECLRRKLWVLHFSNMLGTAFAETAVKYKELDVRLYLPVDDGVFDMLIPSQKTGVHHECIFPKWVTCFASHQSTARWSVSPRKAHWDASANSILPHSATGGTPRKQQFSPTSRPWQIGRVLCRRASGSQKKTWKYTGLI